MRDRRSTPLFDAVPSYLKLRDGQDQRALEALTALLTQELQVVERDVDQLYDNWFVETCEPWVLPYIAEVVGARPMREIGPDRAGQLRAYVANVLQYRQAKGTAAALEQVSRDVTGWPIVAVEFFKHLTMAENVNHLRGPRPVTASVRRADQPQRAHRPFSKAAHLPAAGRADGFSGRFNIPNLGLFVWTRSAQPLFPVVSEKDGYLGGPTPSLIASDGSVRRFDPLGRDVALVNLPEPDTTIADRVSPLNVPEPLQRQALAEELDGLRDGSITAPQWFGERPVLRVRLDGDEVSAENLFCCNLAEASDGSVRRPSNAGHVLFDPVLGRLSLSASDKEKRVETGFAHGLAMDVGGGPYDRRASLERWWGDFFVPGEADPWLIGVTQRAELQTDNPDLGGPVVGTLREAVERWNARAEGSRGVIVLFDSGTYPEAITGTNGTIDLSNGARLAIVAANWPGVPLPDGTVFRSPDDVSPSLCRPFIASRIKVRASSGADDQPARLLLSGLALKDVRMDPGEAVDQLDIHDCTLGFDGEVFGEALRCLGDDGIRLSIERCMLGRIWLPNSTTSLSISDSVLAFGPQPSLGKRVALRAPKSDLEMARCTVLGQTEARAVEVEDSIFAGRVTVAFRQTGCVRFSYATSNSVIPRRYRCVDENSDADGVNDGRQRFPEFVSDDFGKPGFAELTPGCTKDIREGAEGNLEMGVGNHLRVPARLANLRDAITEYAPFGMNCGVIFVEE
ncbi:MAG: hypothetical protein AAGA34_00825 [Pseudomonadota bacterium]